MIQSKIDIRQPEPQPISDMKLIDPSSTPTIGNTPVVGSTVYLMDCVAGMKHYPDKWFDLAVVDPPYGLNSRIATCDNPASMKKHSLSKFRKSILESGWDDSRPTDEYFLELFRVSKEVIIWGGNYFDLWPSRCWIVWHKEVPIQTMSTIEMAWTSFDKPAKFFKFRSRDKDRFHPTQKPIKLYDFIFKHFSKEGMRVLDTHLGSGSSRISADNAKLEFVGFEINKEFYDLSEERFKRYKSQLRIEGW